jgi:cell division septum initiation protein DivIVA
MTDIASEGLRAEATRLRSAEPSRAIRGFDEEQTRNLLDSAASQLDAAAGELEASRRELERLRSETGAEAASEEAIGKALLTATRAGEEIAAEARIAAERVMAEAETRAAAILEEANAAAEKYERKSAAARKKLEAELAAARATMERENAAARLELESNREQVLAEARQNAEAILATAQRDVEQLEDYGERLRSLVMDSQRRFVELAEAALGQLDGVDPAAGSEHGDLLDELRPAGGEPSVAAVAGE